MNEIGMFSQSIEFDWRHAVTILEAGIVIHHVSGLRLRFAAGFMEAAQITSIQARSCNPQYLSYGQIEVPGNDWPVINGHGEE